MAKHEALKRQFVNDEQCMAIPVFFNYAGATEEKLGKDIGQFSFDELVDLLRQFYMISAQSRTLLPTICNQLERYKAFYAKQYNLPAPAAKDQISSYRALPSAIDVRDTDMLYLSRQQVLELGTLLEPRLALFLLAVYTGLYDQNGTVLHHMQLSDIDEKRHVIQTELYGPVAVSDEFIELAVATEKAKPLNPNASLLYVYTPKKTSPADMKALLRTMMYQIKKTVDLPQLDMQNLLMSGFLNQIMKSPEFDARDAFDNFDLLRSERIQEVAQRYGIALRSKTAIHRRRLLLKEYWNLYKDVLLKD